MMKSRYLCILALMIFSCSSDTVPVFSVPEFPRYFDIDLEVNAQSCQFNAFHLQSQKMVGELTQSGGYYYFTLNSDQAEIKLVGDLCLDAQEQPSYFCMRSKSRIRYKELLNVCEAQLRIPLEDLPSSDSQSKAQSIRKPLSCCHENISDDNGIYLEVIREAVDFPDLSMIENDLGLDQPRGKIIGLKSNFEAGLFVNQYLDNAIVSEDCSSQYHCVLSLFLEATTKQ